MNDPKNVHVTPSASSTEQTHELSLQCWCKPYRLPADPRVIVHRKAALA
jgi:hypothetical protein